MDGSSIAGDFRELLRTFATPSLVLSHRDNGTLGRLASCVSAFLRRRWDTLLRDAVDRELPLLFCYASDGWGTKLAEGHAYAAGPHVIRREGRVYTEFLLQRAVLKTIEPDFSVRMAISIVEPQGMGGGKTGWHSWQAACDYAALLRFSAPRNIIMSVYQQDGLHSAAMTRRMLARHELPFGNFGDELQFADPVAREKDWCFGWKCVSHVASNAIKWGMSAHVQAEVVDDFHYVIVAIRVVFTGIADNLEHRRSFWIALGVIPPMLEQVLLINPTWHADSKTLEVSATLVIDPDSHNKIAGVVCYFLRWQNFSETRWAGVGPSVRLLCSSLAIGLDYLVVLVYSCPACSTYYLGGFKRFFSSRVRLYVGIGVFATWPAESFNLEMMKDDRFRARASRLWDHVMEKATYIEGLPLLVWEAVGCSLGLSEDDRSNLRHLSLEAMSASLAYLDRHAFALLKEHPWSLTQGDVAANVADLKTLEGVREITTLKIQACLRLLVPEAIVARALTLLRDMPCSTGMVEKSPRCRSSAAQVPWPLRLFNHRCSGSGLSGRPIVLQELSRLPGGKASPCSGQSCFPQGGLHSETPLLLAALGWCACEIASGFLSKVGGSAKCRCQAQ